MADQKPTTNYYGLLGGINSKVSEYTPNQAQFQDLRNLDFMVPNALQKRPGSTQAVSAGTSGPVTSLFEFEKLDGASYIVAGSDTAMFYLAAGGFTTLSTGWTNGQPTDMLTFVNKLWMANGQNWQSWDGNTVLPVGLPTSPFYSASQAPLIISNISNGTSFFTVGGATAAPVVSAGVSFIARGVYVAYSYLRSDGYMGPADLTKAKNLVNVLTPASEGSEFFAATYATKIFGFTAPTGKGITAIAIWVGVDTIHKTSTVEFIPAYNLNGIVGDLGYIWPTVTPLPGNFVSLSYDLKETADLSRFWLFTLLPVTSLFQAYSSAWSLGSGGTAWATTFSVSSFSFNSYTGIASSARAFSAMPFGFFNTNTPKYIEQNNNVMFMAGFSNTPSTMWFSEIGQPELIDPDANFEVRTNDGDRITGLKSYNNLIIVTKERSFAKVTGSTLDDIDLIELSTEFGCLSNKTMIEADQRLHWLDRRGILEFNGSTWNIISTPVEPIFRRMNLSAAKEKACAVNHLYRNQIWFGIPIDGSTINNITVVYDYLVGAWTFFDGFNPASFALVKGSLSTPTAWRGDYSGKIHYFGESFFGDNGQGITCLGQPNWEIDRGQQSTSVWRRFFLDVATATGVTGTINTTIFSNYDATTPQATFAMYQNQFQSRAEFGVVGKAVSAQFSHYSASLPLLINGFSWTKRFLRNV